MADKVQRMSSEHGVMIFSKSTCCLCYAVTILFRDLGVDPYVHELDHDSDGKDMEKALMRMGCKTTLAYKVYNDKSISSHFDLHAVGQEYDEKKLLDKFFNQVSNSDSKLSENIDVADKLRNGKRKFHTDLLDREKRAFGKESCPDGLLDVGKEIARKCRGFPLVADLIAGVIAGLEKKNTSACKKMVTILFALSAYFSLIYVHHRLMSLNLSHSTTRIPNLGKMSRHSYKLQWLWVVDYIEDTGLEEIADYCKDLEELKDSGRTEVVMPDSVWTVDRDAAASTSYRTRNCFMASA
uniref:Glutaredoxin n=1 Tax=Solanum tuberosum TaxID=4113 RepID=M1A351_SOLTU